MKRNFTLDEFLDFVNANNKVKKFIKDCIVQYNLTLVGIESILEDAGIEIFVYEYNKCFIIDNDNRSHYFQQIDNNNYLLRERM